MATGRRAVTVIPVTQKPGPSTLPEPLELPGEVAGLGRRVAAIAIDWFASILLSRVIFGQLTYGSAESSFAILMIFIAEVVLFTWLMSASFGQRLLGISVVRLDGGRLSLWRIVVRTLLICLIIPAVVYDNTGRGLHDRAVGSVAIRSRRPVQRT
ncbi:MAG: RDD family protein [Actinobacteria bacterium]|nr:RDD family protein [Actinomycetota bacterium]